MKGIVKHWNKKKSNVELLCGFWKEDLQGSSIFVANSLIANEAHSGELDFSIAAAKEGLPN